MFFKCFLQEIVCVGGWGGGGGMSAYPSVAFCTSHSFVMLCELTKYFQHFKCVLTLPFGFSAIRSSLSYHYDYLISIFALIQGKFGEVSARDSPHLLSYSGFSILRG